MASNVRRGMAHPVDGGKDLSKFDGHVDGGIGNGIRRKPTRRAVLA
jgi:hypothetical protein